MKFKNILLFILLITFSGLAHSQVLTDITNNQDQFGLIIPGLACKTRTNTDSRVVNLAHGVWNQSSNAAVALNCAWAAPYPFVINSFGNVRLDSRIGIGWVRTPNTPLATANDAFCTINLSGLNDVNINPVAAGLTLATLNANFGGTVSNGEYDFKSLTTNGVTYPQAVGGVFLSAFCMLPRGVRIQFFLHESNGVNTYTPAP